MTVGPLRKRRGFWHVGGVADQTKLARLVPFRRSIVDALMLEFGDESVRVWQLNGSPLMSPAPRRAGDVLRHSALYADAQLANRCAGARSPDVIYFRTADGQPPQDRISPHQRRGGRHQLGVRRWRAFRTGRGRPKTASPARR